MDPVEDSNESPAQQSVAWAWLGAYAGWLTVSWIELHCNNNAPIYRIGPGWLESGVMAVFTAFDILYLGCVARHRPVWLRIPWLLTLAFGIYLWVVGFIYTVLVLVMFNWTKLDSC